MNDSPSSIAALLRSLWICAAVMAGGIACAAGPSDAMASLNGVIDGYWSHKLRRDPILASSQGVREHDGRLGSLSVASMDEDVRLARQLLQRLAAVDRATLPAADRLNYVLLQRELSQMVAAGPHGGRLMLIKMGAGWPLQFAQLPNQLPFFTEANYRSYLGRLRDYPRYNSEGIDTLRASIAAGYTQNCDAMRGFEDAVAAHVVSDVERSVFMRPFEQMPESVRPSRQRLQAEARQIIADQVLPAYRQFLSFYTTEYMPACRRQPGIDAAPGGKAYYQYLIEVFTGKPASAEQLHELGLAEVQRIRAEMLAAMTSTGFKGDLPAFMQFLRSDPQFYVSSPEELLRRVALIAKRIEGELPRLFATLPRMPYTVKPVPADTAERTITAYYNAPAGDGTRPGIYFVNTTRLDSRPLFELEALTLHESVPGHHLQMALAQEIAGVPPFRRLSNVTAFVEGWGLYAERLGLEVGFYTDAYANFGRLSYEMWRATRLVVDTGLHAKGWSRQQAIDYMTANTALSRHNVTAEVDRYISMPAQALAYKVGELEFRRLRAHAERELGSRFDLRRFHDELLRNGAIPLPTLADLIEEWISREQRTSEIEGARK